MKLLPLLAGLGLLLGCATPPPPAPTPAPIVGHADESIGTEVRRRLSASGNDLVGVILAVSDGVVTLRGSVASPGAALRAEAAARGVAGVKAVRNELLVRAIGY